MASLQAKTDAVKSAIASTNTCTTATVVTVKDLLSSETDSATATSTSRAPSRASRPASSTKSRKTGSRSNGAKTPVSSKDELSAKDKAALATHIINLGIKSLTEAAKPAAPSTPSKSRPSCEDPRKLITLALRPSSSTPLSPIQPKTLNRSTTSPVAAKTTKAQTNGPSTGCLSTVECLRAAFACLRSIKGSPQLGQTDFQLETGMSALVGKLLGLGLHEPALKELRVLRKRLDQATTAIKKSATNESTNAAQIVAELLEYDANVPDHSLTIITTCQLQVLRLISLAKRPAYTEAALPHLLESRPSSPLNLLLRLAKIGSKEAQKVARQLATLSQTLLALAPSVSSKEDSVATEPRLSTSPSVALHLQLLAFKTQLTWWKLAGHKGVVDDDVLSPFVRCLKAFSRRQKAGIPTYKPISTSFDELMHLVKAQKSQPFESFSSPLASIYQLIGSVAQTERLYDEAHRWYTNMRAMAQPQSDSLVQVCSISARLLSVSLKRTNLDSDVEGLAREVVEGLDGSLSGSFTELNELLEGLSSARRSAVGVLVNARDKNASTNSVPESLSGLLKTFILRYPRFARRWLGAPPGKDASAKHILQFDQRRQALSQAINQILDATLVVTNLEVQAGAMDWKLMDDTLHDCVMLLEAIVDPTMSTPRTEQLGTYYVKISSLYFARFSQLRKEMGQSKEVNKQILQALSRSIEAVKERSLALQEKAQLPTKLELFADLCKGAGRGDDAVRILRSICTNMIEEGALVKVTGALASQSPALAWTVNDKAETLSRTLRSIAKLDKSWNDWAFFLPETERAAVLEHLMHISAETLLKDKPLGLQSSATQALLRVLTIERFPIRRLRVLLRLLFQNLGESTDINEIQLQVEQVMGQVQRGALVEDVGLSRYVSHLQAYHTSLSVLASTELPFPGDAMKEAILSWRYMVESCKSRAELFEVIDNPEGLVTYLQSAGHFANLRGEANLQLSILELATMLSRACAGTTSNTAIENQTLLASQHLVIGHYSEAKKTLETTKASVSQAEGVSQGIIAGFYLSEAEYFAGIGDMDEATSSLMLAKDICNGPTASWATSKAQANMLISLAAFLESTVALRQGYAQEALAYVKDSIRLLSHDWAKAEASASRESSPADTSVSETSISDIKEKSSVGCVIGPRFWGLAFPLLRGLLHLSSVYAHLGMFQETVYYAESAQKIAENTCSPLYQAQVAAWTGSIYHRAGKLDKALKFGDEARELLPEEICASRVQLACQLSDLYRDLDQDDMATELLRMAEVTTQRLADAVMSAKAQAQIESPRKATSRGRGNTATTSAAKPARATRTRAPAASTESTTTAQTQKRATAAKAVKTQAISTKAAADLPTDVYQASLMASVVLSRALGLIGQKDWSTALSILEQVKDIPKLFATLSQEQVVTAISLIGHSTDQMIQDPVFSVIQDSTISFPAVSNCGDKAATDRKGAKETALPAFADALKKAQEILLEAHTSTLKTANSTMVHRISALLQSTVILLSAMTTTMSKTAATSGFATFSVDLARNITWRREQSTLQTPKAITIAQAEASAARRFSLGLNSEMSHFQKNYVDLLPEAWSAISISLSDNHHDLCITKFQAGHSPFILRLPLERANSRDADSEVFNFAHGREEMLDIIEQANETSHSAKDFTAKGARSEWWAERESLDNRLKELLEMIESTWLGGFKGIFSQHRRRSDLLARFQKSFEQILDNSLPSRNKLRGKKTAKTPKVTLDPRILDLFIGLGDPNDEDSEFEEVLNDLLYFVVDILQFHGERNAYDEIDFDAMVVETHDALRGYSEASKCEGMKTEGAHTVLVLDKALHAFPWESMPCMEGLAVSRVPSLACLRQLITESRQSRREGQPQGHFVSGTQGTYILNPSSDLKNTQSTFQSKFKALLTWTSIVNRVPSEADFETALTSSDILLYFGHGSGAQYVRARTIRRLDKCKPATFLMGCSSAALTEAGEFESYGPIWNYMMAGCPAVVGTLWDVTDRDIDRFAGRAFEYWGLFPKGTFRDEKKGKKKALAHDDDDDDDDDDYNEQRGGAEAVSLAEAVAKARSVCKFKYLNAAAVVLYGIPVYINKKVRE